MNIVRQGDILLMEIKQMPSSRKQEGPCILAYGEATGHTHHVKAGAEIWVDLNNEGKRYLKVLNDASLDHEEHGYIALTKGVYEIIRQVEYHPQAIRQVAD